MKSYVEADKLLQGRNLKSRKLKKHTYLLRHEKLITVRLHNTDVVTYYPDGKVRLTSGGWKTVTTKDRINQFSPIEITQENGSWYLGNWMAPEKERVLFYDGMIISRSGKVARVLKNDPTVRNMKLINRYCKRLAEMDELPEPNNGDCWLCLMRDENGNSMGDMAGDNSHIESHLKEVYIHGSLIVNAMKLQGLGPFYFQYGFRPKVDDKMSIRPTIVRSVKKYLKRKMGIAN